MVNKGNTENLMMSQIEENQQQVSFQKSISKEKRLDEKQYASDGQRLKSSKR